MPAPYIRRRSLLAAIPVALWVAGGAPIRATARDERAPVARPGAWLQQGGELLPRASTPMLAADGDFPPPPPPPPPAEDASGRPSWDSTTLNSVVRAVSTDRAIAALTLDDAWSSRSEVLDALAGEGVTATFFAVGRVLTANPEFVRRALDEGHEFGNHTHDHVYAPTAQRNGTLSDQLRAAEATLQRIAPNAALKPYFRPPGGGYDANVVAAAAAEGYRTILWSVDPWDWKWPLSADRVVPFTRPGSIVLNHFCASTAANLGGVIRRLREEHGIQFVTLTELFRSQSS